MQPRKKAVAGGRLTEAVCGTAFPITPKEDNTSKNRFFFATYPFALKLDVFAARCSKVSLCLLF